MHIETERKFLIEMPDIAMLKEKGCRVLHITQTYLAIDNETGTESRVRMITENGGTTYVFTEKKRITSMSRTENEYEITKAEYERLRAADDIRELTKIRYALPHGEHTLEIDVYPHEIGGDGLDGKAILEVELDAENETIPIPEYIKVIRELTGTGEFSNKSMAKPVK